MEIQVGLYVRCKTAEKRDRLVWYFNPTTRPDFAEDVPEAEGDLVELFESMPDPDEIGIPPDSENEVLIQFEEEDGDEKKRLLEALPFFCVERCLWWEGDGMDGMDIDVYYQYNAGEFEFFYSAEPWDDPQDNAKYNSNLAADIVKGLKGAREKGLLSSLLYLGRQKVGRLD